MKSVVFLLASTATAAAQVSDIEVPTIVLDVDVSQSAGEDDVLDLANIVQSAAKGLTTVQEAPAIVTVITADEIRERQFQTLLDLVDTVPGWQRSGMLHSFFPSIAVRGQVQAVQFLQDGVSMFDPFTNIPAVGRQQPMELIKRVEMITGPGGVLWGSNSLLGILNIISKDAEDVEGVEVGSSIGHGVGDRLMARAYMMAGNSDVLDGKLKLFGHGSVETYQGAGHTMPLLLFHQPLPQPNSANTYGPLTQSDQQQALIVNLSGKATLNNNLTLRVQFPLGRMSSPMGLSGNPVVRDLPEDARPECANDGEVEPTCLDNLRKSRANEWRNYDRFVVGEYRDRFANGKAGITLRGYGIQFVRGIYPLSVLAPSTAIQGGLEFTTNMTHYRAGGALDADVEIAKPLRVLYGAEAFTEWVPDTTDGSRQGGGAQSNFHGPYDLTRLPLPCPRIYDQNAGQLVPVPECPLTYTFTSSRSVMGAYINPQLRPNKKLILDAGARVQVAPEQLGTLGYDMSITTAGTIVWNFIPNWHLKLNYAQGFRPPVFQNAAAGSEAVLIAGDPNLKVETSDAMQAELNARIFKGERRIRELSFRVDGSYTRLKNLIQVNQGAFANTGDRGVSSAELLGKLYVQGGHRLELAYTWMRIGTADRGVIKSMPEHWFNFSTVFNLVSNKLTAMTNLKIAGAGEDANRLVEYRDTTYDMNGHVMNPVSVSATDLVLDRIPATADLSLGLTWTPMKKLLVRGTVYNALLQHAYQPDFFFDYEPHLEYLPNPEAGFRAYFSAMYQY